MLKILKILSLSVLLTACGEQVEMDRPQSTAIFVLVENGGSVAKQERDHAMNTTLHLLQQLSTLARRKATRHAQIHIVLSASPNRIAWSGTPEQLLLQAQEVRTLIAFKPSFSDLVLAYEQIQTTINLTQPDDIRLYTIGPFIHVPFQNSDNPIDISVPQDIPQNLPLSHFVDRLSTLKFMNVHDDQDLVLQAYLASLGVLIRARDGSISFSLKGKAQTKASLTDLL